MGKQFDEYLERRKAQERMFDILRRFVKAEDFNVTDDILVRQVFNRYSADRGVYLIDPNE